MDLSSVLSVLAVLGALGGGASVGSYFAHKLRERSERKQRRRELEGLASIILYEMESNRTTIAANIGGLRYEWSDELFDINVSADAWKAWGARTATILAEAENFANDFGAVVTYYYNLRKFEDELESFRRMAEAGNADPERAADSLGSWADQLRKDNKEAESVLVKYLSSGNPFAKSL